MSRQKLQGQWAGKYTGSSDGTIILNVDELQSHYQGVAYLHEDNKNLPSTAAGFRTSSKDQDLKFRTDWLLPIDPSSGVQASWESVKARYLADVIPAQYADVTGTCNDNFLTLSWVTDIGSTGTCVLPRSMADKPSDLVALNAGWAEHKDYVASLEARRYLFRGQSEQRRLRTSYHRTGRADLTRFLREDIQALHRHLSARTRHVFNLQIPDENGAFFNLVQHHGYPTPLLDWTYSPYVASFFAYRGISNARADVASRNEKVRIFVFDQAQWKADWSQVLQLVIGGLHVSIGEFIAIENERMIPQQAASTLTNVDDIESYIKSKESETKKYLWAIDLPVCDRRHVVRELGNMGITAGSLFPGLDGACEELEQRNFEI